MNVSSVSAQEAIMPTFKSEASNQVQKAVDADVKVSASRDDSVTISKESPKPPSVEDFGDINDNEIKPNAQALEHMSSAEAAQFGSGTLVEKEIDTMKSIAMSNYLEHLEEMNLPNNQIPNANGNNFHDTDLTFQNGGAFGDIDVVNINININEGENGDKVSPLAGKTEQTGPAE